MQSFIKPASNWRFKYSDEFQNGTFVINGCRSNGIRRKYSDSHIIVPDLELENKYLGQCILTQISVKKGIKKLGSEAVEAVINEWKQMNEKNTFVPILASELSKEDKVRALRMIMFIKRKRCGRIKARGCADGRKQRNYIPKEDASSPIVSTEGLMISYVLDAKENFKVLQYYLRKANSNKNSLPDPSINITIHDTNIPITIDNFSS